MMARCHAVHSSQAAVSTPDVGVPRSRRLSDPLARPHDSALRRPAGCNALVTSPSRTHHAAMLPTARVKAKILVVDDEPDALGVDRIQS